MAKSTSAQPSRHRSRRDRLRVAPCWAWHYQALVALRDHLVLEQASPQAADQFDRDFIRTLLSREADPLGEIHAAIGRILHGDYGICEKTGRRIAPERLRAAPWIRRRAD